jgi:cytochrome c oxidase subunit 1
MGKFHFWITFLGSYAIYFPMHYQGFVGVPRRYFEIYDSPYIETSTISLNIFITIAALVVGFAQLVFLYNIILSARAGKPSPKNPWKANSLEWLTPEMPPEHGNFGKELPKVYRWAYDFSVPGAKDDYITQTTPPSKVVNAKAEQS